jgi:hypothetical protein
MSNYYKKEERLLRAQQGQLLDRGILPYCFEEHRRAIACFGAALQFSVGELGKADDQANPTDTTGILVPVPFYRGSVAK